MAKGSKCKGWPNCGCIIRGNATDCDGSGVIRKLPAPGVSAKGLAAIRKTARRASKEAIGLAGRLRGLASRRELHLIEFGRHTRGRVGEALQLAELLETMCESIAELLEE